MTIGASNDRIRLKFFIGQDKDLYPLGDHVLLPPFLGLVPFLAEVGNRLRTRRTDDESFEIIRQFLEFFWIHHDRKGRGAHPRLQCVPYDTAQIEALRGLVRKGRAIDNAFRERVGCLAWRHRERDAR